MGRLLRDNGNKATAYELGQPHWPPGVHFYSDLLRCPKLVSGIKGPEDEIQADGFGIGTLCHAYMHMYYTGVYDDDPSNPEPGDIPFVNVTGELMDIDPKANAEALRLTDWVRGDGHWREFGHVIQAEKRHGIWIDSSGDPQPDSDTHQRVRDALFGFGYPFGWTEDLIVEVDDKAADGLRLIHGIDVEPGRWIVDHKFERAHTKTIIPQYENSLQFAIYSMAAKAYHGWDNLRGVLAHVVFKKKTPERLVIPVSYPDSTMRACVETFVRNVHQEMERVQERGWYPRAGNHCFFPFVCRLFESGECLRGEV